ncbi:TOR complex subunit lst8 [Microbotryomycetes sp. JL221]|nr:TOR complex subunit lst8 [Microbotryomycetes sp. JL221]
MAPARQQQQAPPPLPHTAHLPPQTSQHSQSQSQSATASTAAAASASAAAQQDALSVILVTGGYDNTIRFWEAWSGVCSRTINHQEHQVNRLSISPDKRFLAAAGHGTVKLYDIAATAAGTGGANVGPLVTLTGHTSNVTSLAWHAEGKWLVSGSEDGTVKIWDIRYSLNLDLPLRGNGTDLQTFFCSFVSGTRTATPQRNYAHFSPVNDVALHSNQGELISCDQNGAIKIWDLGADCCSHDLLPEEDVPMRSVSIASDGSSLVAGNHKGIVYVWNIQPGLNFTSLQPRTKFQAHSRYLIKVVVSPDTKNIATCSADTTIKIWSPASSTSLSTLNGNATATMNGGSSNGTVVDNSSYVLDKVLQGHQRWVWDMAYSADSAYLVSASSDHTARLWELASGTTVRQDTIRVESRDFGKPPSEAIRQEIETRYANKVIPGVGLCISLLDILDSTEGAVLYGDGCLYYKCEFRLIMFRPYVGEAIIGKARSQSEEGIKVSVGFFDDILVPASLLPEWSAFDPARRLFFWIPEDPDNPRPVPPSSEQLLKESEESKLFIGRGDLIKIRVEEEMWDDSCPVGSKPNLNTNDSMQQNNVQNSNLGSNVNGVTGTTTVGTTSNVQSTTQTNGTTSTTTTDVIQKAPYRLICSMGEPGTGVLEWWRDDVGDEMAQR